MRFLKAFSERQLIHHRRNEDARNEIQTFDINARMEYFQLELPQHLGGTEQNRFHK
jgi:hypothetical protein